jgi:CHAT domain-containing protein/Tfp pilus assembly protein PilF
MRYRPTRAFLAAAATALGVLAACGRLAAGDAEDFQRLSTEFDRQAAAGKYAEAEKTAQQMRRLAEGPLAKDEKLLGQSLDHEGRACLELDRYAEAETLVKQALAIREKVLGPAHPDVAQSLTTLGWLYDRQGRYAEAEPLLRRALAIREKALGPAHADVAQSLTTLGLLLQARDRFAEAEPVLRRALAIREQALGPDNPAVAQSLNNLGLLYRRIARYTEAEPLLKRSLAIREKALGPEHPDVALTLSNLAALYQLQGRHTEAESLVRRALAMREKALGPQHHAVAESLYELGNLYHHQGRYAEAEPLMKRALAVRQQVLGGEHPSVASSLNDMAVMYQAQGRYAEAEPLLQRAVAIREKALGPEHISVAQTLNNLAFLYERQGRYAEAEPLVERSLAIREKALGPEHPDVARSLSILANLRGSQRRYKEAEPLVKRCLAIREKVLGPEHPLVAANLNNLAWLYMAEHRYAEAEPLYQRSLAIREKALGPEHPEVAWTLAGFARLRYEQKRYEDAEPLADRAITIADRSGIDPGSRYGFYLLRARIGWQQNLRSEALADLHQAMQLAEQLRFQSSGSAHERAETFGHFSNAFEQMLAWQLELKDMSEALSAIERGRARSLLDEMTEAGADLLAGVPAGERQALRARERDLKEAVERIERRIEALEAEQPVAPRDKQDEAARRTALQAELAKARTALYEHYRDIRSTSPVYRQLLSTAGGPPRLGQVQRQMAADGGLLLVYLLGSEGGYVFAVTAQRAELNALVLDAAAAKALGVRRGPLHAKRLGEALLNRRGTGVVQQLQDARHAADAQAKLAVLWQALVPQAYRDALVSGKLKRLVVVPDGALSLLPFETLVVRPGPSPQYLLDVGPPIRYGPSATVLRNLTERVAAAVPAGREPVLTVGNPDYGVEPPAAPPGHPLGPAAPAGAPPLDQLAARSRYSARGGKLTPLPFSGTESQWVADVFGERGIRAARLEGRQATKANLESLIEDRRLVHLACHGFAEQSYGNFYGALALAPGPKTGDPADDGFLTLADIYQLHIKACELAILSACQTNFGPQQNGEGVWALSRGFLVAGARRVLASNWLVDDEAAASLVSYFCGGVALAEQAGKPPDYADALHRAKRWVRQQDKWQSPYYWGTFVLVGPN